MATQGPLSPVTVVNDTAVGSRGWNNPERAASSDNSRAYAYILATGTSYTYYLKATGFGFAIPTGSIINGITVEVEKRSDSDAENRYAYDSEIKLLKNSVVGNTNKSTATHWPATDAYASYGGSADMWGAAWTAEDINNSNFGVVVSAKGVNSVDTFSIEIDHIRVTVDFTAPNPDPPTGLTRANFDATDAATFTWTFNDPNPGDTQSAYQLLIYDASDNSLDYDSGKVSSAASSKTLTAATLANGKQYQWKVRVYDAADNVSEYSSLASFYTSAKPTISITSPAVDHDDITTALISIGWSSTDQTSYRARLYTSGALQLEDSGIVVSAAASHNFTTTAENAGAYYATVIIYDDKDISSALQTRYFEAAFVAPPTPTISVTADNTRGSVTISITNPAPGGGQPAFDHNEVWRKKSTESVYTRTATGIAEDATYIDYTPGSGVTYNYKVRAVGVNTGYADSGVSNQSIVLTAPQLANTADYSEVIYLSANARSNPGGVERKLMQFDGRSAPVAEYGVHTDEQLSIATIVEAGDALAALVGLLLSRQILLYRDERGRRAFVTTDGYNVDDIIPTGYRVKFRLDSTSFTEAV